MGLCQEMRGNPRWITLVSLYSTSTLDQHHTVCLYHLEFHNGLPDNLGRDALFSFHSRVTNQEPLIQELLLFKLSCPAWNDWTGQTPNGFFFDSAGYRLLHDVLIRLYGISLRILRV